MHYTNFQYGNTIGNFIRLYSTDQEQLEGAVNSLMSYNWGVGIEPIEWNDYSDDEDADVDERSIKFEAVLIIYTFKCPSKKFDAVAKEYPYVYIEVTSFAINFSEHKVFSYNDQCAQCSYDDSDKYYYVWGDRDLLRNHGFIEFDEDESVNSYDLYAYDLPGYDFYEQRGMYNPFRPDYEEDIYDSFESYNEDE